MPKLEPYLEERLEAWLDERVPRDLRKELEQLVEQEDWNELKDRFATELEFGTGGLRGIVGAGTNRMNILNVRKATKGLADFLLNTGFEPGAEVVIARDSRRGSYEFSRAAAEVLASSGFRAILFNDIKPTPLLSFTVRARGAAAGIVLTASHNPPEYNGYKVFDSTGCQVVSPWDKNIISFVQNVTDIFALPSVDFDEGVREGKIILLDDEMDDLFIRQSVEFVSRFEGGDLQDLKIVYTPLHGTGYRIVPKMLKAAGFGSVTVVEEQAVPDGSFPTTASPNPEEREALSRGISLMEQTGSDILLATDPDADRVGVAVRDSNGETVLLNGNRTLSLLTDYVLSQLSETGRLCGNNVVIKTIVTSDLVSEIAKGFGVDVVETLTGFKYIGEKINAYDDAAAEGKERVSWALASEDERRQCYQEKSRYFTVGGEESYGYSIGTFIRDKDALTAVSVIVRMASYWKAKGKTLVSRLEEIFEKTGYFEEGVLNFKFSGIEGKRTMERLMDELRNNPVDRFANVPIQSVVDIQQAEIEDIDGKRLPSSNVVIFHLAENRGRVIARPSGTEPKVKFYILVRFERGRDVSTARREATEFIRTVQDELQGIIDSVRVN